MEKELTRRSVMKFFGMGAAAAAAAAAAPAGATAVQPKKWDRTVDVLVVGGGAAGMFAAVSAKEAGAKRVVLIEKNPALYLNSTTYSNGLASACGTKAQKKFGIQDPGVDSMTSEIYENGKRIGDKALIRTYAEHSAEAMDWLFDRGIPFTMIPNPAYSVKRSLHNGTESGGAYIELLEKEGKKLGVQFVLSTRAERLVTTADGSRVLGVIVNQDGKTRAIKAEKGVILATGGFFGDVKLLDRYLPQHRGALSCSSPASTGDGLLMATKVGADTINLDYGAIYAYGLPTDPEHRRGMIFRGHYAGIYGTIVVGRDGKRFVKDETGSAGVTNAAVAAGYSMVYLIATQAQLDDFMANDQSQVIGWDRKRWNELLEKKEGFAFKSDSIEDLAKQLGVDPKGLLATVERYNGFVKAGKDADFGRKNMKGGFEKGPFWGFKCPRVAVLSSGGLRVNTKLQVVDGYGKAIRGLYAAGEVVGGIHGASYATGNAVGSALTLGRVAGQNAAKA